MPEELHMLVELLRNERLIFYSAEHKILYFGAEFVGEGKYEDWDMSNFLSKILFFCIYFNSLKLMKYA